MIWLRVHMIPLRLGGSLHIGSVQLHGSDWPDGERPDWTGQAKFDHVTGQWIAIIADRLSVHTASPIAMGWNQKGSWGCYQGIKDESIPFIFLC